jgi:hypothetical protein
VKHDNTPYEIVPFAAPATPPMPNTAPPLSAVTIASALVTDRLVSFCFEVRILSPVSILLPY